MSRAREARRVLVEQYWDARHGLFRPEPAGRLPRLVAPRLGQPWHYWWQSQALEALLDGVDAGDPDAAASVPLLVAGATVRAGGDLTDNAFVDDLAWMGLATWRAAGAGLLPAEVAVALAAATLDGYDAVHGGFRWRRGSTYRNVAASAPAAILLARTAEAAGGPRWLEVARTTAAWLHDRLVDDEGRVRDGCRRRAGVEVVNPTMWSYTAGAVAGLDVELARHADPGQAAALLARAARVVRAGSAVLRSVPPTDGRVWRDEAGPGSTPEAALFRGILARFAADLVSADPTRTVDVAADMGIQAEAAWRARDARGRVGSGWVLRDTGPPSLAAHLGGTLTLHAVERISRS